MVTSLKESMKGREATIQREIHNETLRAFETELKGDGAGPSGEACAQGA
jgi:hypothetical protein